jgi:hypothetical protein
MMKMTNVKNGETNSGRGAGSKMTGQSRSSCHGAAGYEIRVRDHLDSYWLKWFDGWSVTNLENGEVQLKSYEVDQSGLHGALNKIRDLNLTLLSVTCIPAVEFPIPPSESDAKEPAKKNGKNTRQKAFHR